MSSLAVLGRDPRFDRPLLVGRPNLGSRERFSALVEEVLDRRWFSNDGPLVIEFERRVAALSGAAEAVAVVNATSGLELTLRALDLRGEVILPSFTFVATAHAVLAAGLTPVFADIDEKTHNLDPDAVQALIGPGTGAILGVHLWGRPLGAPDLAELADDAGVPIVFDAAHAFAAGTGGRLVGSFGRAEVLSFHATKLIGAAEGGVVLTDDGALAAELRLMRNFGISAPDTVERWGTNAKMNELSAALGLTSVEAFGDIRSHNVRNHQQYATALADVEGVAVLHYEDVEPAAFPYVVVEVDVERFGLSRDELQQVLVAENVMARRYFWPGCHRQQPYRERMPDVGVRLPATERVAGRVLVLPTGQGVTVDDIDVVAELTRLASSHAPAVRRSLSGAGRRERTGV